MCTCAHAKNTSKFRARMTKKWGKSCSALQCFEGKQKEVGFVTCSKSGTCGSKFKVDKIGECDAGFVHSFAEESAVGCGTNAVECSYKENVELVRDQKVLV